MNLFNKKKSELPKRRSAEYVKNTPPTSNTFKRNRTLTGTTSNHLVSTNTNTGLESPRTHTHNLLTQRRKIVGILILVFVSAVLIWVLVSNFTASVSISLADIGMSKPVDSSKYEKAIQNYLDINPMSRFSFILDQSAITKYVSSKLPEVSEIKHRNIVSIGKSNFTITMRTPVAGWQINNKQYYVDSKGMPFEYNYFSAPLVQIIDNSGISLKIGSMAIASNRFLSFVGRVVSQTKASGYTVTQASLPVNTTRELEIRLKEGNYLVKLSIDRLVGEQVEDMVAAVRYFSERGQNPKYIDVRVSGKAFFR